MPTPYTDIIQKLKLRFSLDNNPTDSAVQQYRNFCSSLNGYLAFCGKTVDSNIGAELNGHFENKLKEYISNIDVSERTRRDRILHLRKIQQLYIESPQLNNSPQSKPSSLAIFLRKIISEKGDSLRGISASAEMDHKVLSSWLRGATPRSNSIPTLRRLEKALGLEAGALTHFAKDTAEDVPVLVPTFRQRFSERACHGLPLSENDLPPELIEELGLLLTYKVSGSTKLERETKGFWRLIPRSMSKPLSKLATRGEMVCPTANIFIQSIRTYLGVLSRLPASAGGITWKTTPVMSLALCAHPETLDCFLQWITSQSNGVRHNGQKVFARAIASLVRPQTGFLWQQPEIFRTRLPEQFRPASDAEWQAMCARSHKFLRSYIRSATGLSRNPEEPIFELLASPFPLKPIFEAIKRIEAEAAACPPGSVSEARHKRNALILALLVSNPLRDRTLSSLTWLPNGSGSLKGSPRQGWRIYLQPMHLKNGDSQSSRNYSVKVLDWVKPMMDAYIEEYRDTILGGKSSPYFLVGSEDHKMWAGLGRTVRQLTEKYIPGSPGFGPQAIRHLVATDWLRNHPDDFITVAKLLNDRIETVLENYAHLQRDDSFSRYEEHIQRVRNA